MEARNSETDAKCGAVGYTTVSDRRIRTYYSKVCSVPLLRLIQSRSFRSDFEPCLGIASTEMLCLLIC